MIRKILLTSKRPRVVIRYRRPDEPRDATTPSIQSACPWHGQRLRIEDLPAFRARWGLIVVGGDPDLDAPAGSWAPKVYLVEA